MTQPTTPEPAPGTLVLTGRSESVGKLVEALAAVQEQAVIVEADETAQVVGENQEGKRYSYDYDYAPLDKVTEAIMPLLGKNGLVFVAWPMYTPRGFALVYQLMHTSGQWIGGEWTLPKAKPQTVGSEITYARRYCLCALTGVAVKGKGADDDGRLASERYGDYDARPPARQERPQQGPSPLSERLAYLRQVVQAAGLPEEEVPHAFQARYGLAINTATPEQVQVYIDHVQATGLLGDVPADEFDAPASWGGPPTDETRQAVNDAAAATADAPSGGEQS